MTWRLTIAYDGTDFAGWQRQARERTVQSVLEDALARIEQAEVTIVGAGRTDAGVHAAGQVASVSLQRAIARDDLARALNATLPEDVRVLAVEDGRVGFNARFDARRKTYHYWIWNGPVMPPPLRRYAWHVPQELDVEAMNAAAAVVIGEHDFSAFRGAGSDIKTSVRHLHASVVEPITGSSWVTGAARGQLLRYRATGSGFLRYMVRNLAGTLTEIGRGRRPAAEMAAILRSKDRAQASPTAPPHGLVLWEVEY